MFIYINGQQITTNLKALTYREVLLMGDYFLNDYPTMVVSSTKGDKCLCHTDVIEVLDNMIINFENTGSA